jgi:hypothetical protein
MVHSSVRACRAREDWMDAKYVRRHKFPSTAKLILVPLQMFFSFSFSNSSFSTFTIRGNRCVITFLDAHIVRERSC